MRKSIAIIGASDMACVYARKAREMNIKTICFAWAEGASAKDFVDVFYPISIFEKEKILEICRQEKVDGVVCTTELTIAIAAYIAENMSLPGLKMEIAENITNKFWVREHSINCKEINHPIYRNCKSKEDSVGWSVYPAIIKPASEGGKRGVCVVNNEEELLSQFELSLGFDKHNNGVVLEGFLSGGQEYSVESITQRGKHKIIQVTEKISSGPPHCVELGHHQPAKISIQTRETIVNGITSLLDSIGYESGATHIEIKIIDGKIYLIELNARIGGDFISSKLVQLSTGYDYIAELIKVAIGEDIKDYVEKVENYVGVYFVTKQTADLKKVFDECDDAPWLYEKHVESDNLVTLTNNDCEHTNYIIYCSDKRIDLL